MKMTIKHIIDSLIEDEDVIGYTSSVLDDPTLIVGPIIFTLKDLTNITISNLDASTIRQISNRIDKSYKSIGKYRKERSK